MLRYGFIGFGQAGGSFANLVPAYGYPTLAINTASVDLETLGALGHDEKMHLYGYEGAGKDREIGREAFLDHQEAIEQAFRDRFSDCHVLFPSFSLGGGTGSGMVGVALQSLTALFPAKVICPILFFPSQQESFKHKMNALEAYSECTQNIDMGATFLIDNDRIHQHYASFSLKDKFEKHHTDFLESMHALNQRTEKASSLSTIDKMDLLTTLSERGGGMISRVELEEEQLFDPTLLKEQLVTSFTHTAFCESDIRSFNRVAYSLDLPMKCTSRLCIDETLQTIGTPLDIFSGIYDAKTPSGLVLLTGLAYPTKIVDSMESAIRKKEDRLLQSHQRNQEQQYEVNNSWEKLSKKRKKLTLS